MADTVLVTGGSGFIGSHLSRMLIERGDNVINLDLSPRRGPLAWFMRDYESRITFEQGAAQNLTQLIQVVKTHEPNKIAHLAASTDIGTLVKNPKLAYGDMLGATINVLETTRLFEVERLVNFSSIGALPGKKYEPIDADHPVLLANEGTSSAVYGAGKVAGEAFCWAYREAYGIDFITLRPSAAYGFYTSNPIYLNEFLEAALRGEPIHFDHGMDYPCDYTHVGDIAGICVAALNVPAEKLTHRVFYAASGMDPLVTAEQVAQIVRELVPSADIGIGPGLNYVDSLEIRMRGVLDVQPVKEQLGYRIKYRDVRAGMVEHADRYCEWLASQGKTPARRMF